MTMTQKTSPKTLLAAPGGPWHPKRVLRRVINIGRFCLLGSLLLGGASASGQVVQPGAAGPIGADLSTPAMRYFGHGQHRLATRPQAPRQAPRQGLPTQRFQRTGGKPFQNIHRPPTISPYLGFDTIESSVGLPNYYSRVLPQIRQQEASLAQAAEQRRLQRQAHLANASGKIPNPRENSSPKTGYRTQFLNSGSYFPSVRR